MNDAADTLNAYLVGGAVRDQILGKPITDRDWVVVGATPEKMLALGFKPVGDDFPVFLHPKTHEEYALARRERKTAKGYRGFDIISDPSVTLEQDLLRRDLTINAMAMDPAGNLIDPHGGSDDIARRQLRHVSPAFAEDPVRVLRVARFRARFDAERFQVAADTRALMAEMVRNGEVDALQPERIWQELQRALAGNSAARFIAELRDCGALAKILPEVDALFGVPQRPEYHPEIDTGTHILLCLDAAEKLSTDPKIRFAVLTHDLGKGVTPPEVLPSHRGHELAGIPLVEAVCERLRVPEKYRKLALRVCEFHLHHHRMAELKPSTVLKLLERLDGFRQPEQVAMFSACCIADARGRTGMENQPSPQADLLARYHAAAASIDAAALARRIARDKQRKKHLGVAIQRELASRRRVAIAKLKPRPKLKPRFKPKSKSKSKPKPKS